MSRSEKTGSMFGGRVKLVIAWSRSSLCIVFGAHGGETLLGGGLRRHCLRWSAGTQAYASNGPAVRDTLCWKTTCFGLVVTTGLFTVVLDGPRLHLALSLRKVGRGLVQSWM